MYRLPSNNIDWSPDTASVVYEYSTEQDDDSSTETDDDTIVEDIEVGEWGDDVQTQNKAENDVCLTEYHQVYVEGMHSDGDDPQNSSPTHLNAGN